MTTETIRTWHPAVGPYPQGDILITSLAWLGIDADPADGGTPIPAVDGVHLAQEGEATGHFHALFTPPMYHDGALARALTAAAAPTPATTVDLWRNALLTSRLPRDMQPLVIAFATVTGGDALLRHALRSGDWAGEHDAVRVPPGRYVISGQREWESAEARRVAD